MVDLPGYGFAYAKEEVKESWEELVSNLKCVCENNKLCKFFIDSIFHCFCFFVGEGVCVNSGWFTKSVPLGWYQVGYETKGSWADWSYGKVILFSSHTVVTKGIVFWVRLR